jgi:hypothetical protein
MRVLAGSILHSAFVAGVLFVVLNSWAKTAVPETIKIRKMLRSRMHERRLECHILMFDNLEYANSPSVFDDLPAPHTMLVKNQKDFS